MKTATPAPAPQAAASGPALATIPVELISTICVYLEGQPFKEVARMLQAVQAYVKPVVPPKEAE